VQRIVKAYERQSVASQLTLKLSEPAPEADSAPQA